MGRTLQPEDIIDHYRVIGPLGAGGMGEVYLAQDLRLNRDVALKVLPFELVRSEDRVKRFILEAKSASSLNHPHIVTIYDIGHHPVQPAGDAQASDDEVHYIAMELINGKTLNDHIHADKTDLKTLLGHLAQAAEGLSKAHASGIVHRDLKPGNIMISNDGYAKVVDFGLAKLTEKGADEIDATSAPTEAEKTTAGAVVGTVGYMSPEQVKGKKVDHRSDVFSFGCILYEAATRTRPFLAESRFDTMHKIVHENPRPIDEINAEVPAELRRLIKRCLAKNPDQRLQSIKDLAIELREIVDEFDTLSATASSTSGISRPLAVPRRSTAMTILMAVVVVLGVAGIGLGSWSLLGPASPESSSPAPFQTMRMRRLMDDSNVLGATLSGDGRYLAYIKGPLGAWSLRVRQVSTGSDAEILAPQPMPIRGVGFSPDGDYLYYLGSDPETPNYSALFEVPSLGGTPRRRLFDVDTALAFSPDSKRAAFVRGVPHKGESHLIIADLETEKETLLAVTKSPQWINSLQPAWSPDGKRIVVTLITADQGTRNALAAFDAATGDREPITDWKTSRFRSFAWLPDGTGLIGTTPPEVGLPSQIFFIPYPEGRARQITRDLDEYGEVSVSAEGTSIATLRASQSASPWVAPVNAPGVPRRIGTWSSNSWPGDIRTIQDGTIIYTAYKDRHRYIWRMNQDGTGKLQLTSQAGWSSGLVKNGKRLTFTHTSEADGTSHVWRVGLQGDDLRQITEGSGEFLRAVSPDGRVVLFGKTGDFGGIWRTSSDGGEPEKFLEGVLGEGCYSPDGRRLFYQGMDVVDGRSRDSVMIIPSGGGDPITRFLPPGDWSTPEWTPDGSALTYLHTVGGVENLWRQPVDGGDPVQVTRFPEGLIRRYEYSPDGTLIAMVRVLGGTQNIWTVHVDGTRATPITEFREGEIFDEEWSADSLRLIFSQGEWRRDVILLEDSGS